MALFLKGTKDLFDFVMSGMLATALAELADLEPVRMLLLVFGRGVISIFADRAL